MTVPRRVDNRMRAVETRIGHPDRLAVLAVEDAEQLGGVLAQLSLGDAHQQRTTFTPGSDRDPDM